MIRYEYDAMHELYRYQKGTKTVVFMHNSCISILVYFFHEKHITYKELQATKKLIT
jgi:hypothetical protein